jgi:hypothetical protein
MFRLKLAALFVVICVKNEFFCPLDELGITTSQREPLLVNNAEMELPLAKVPPISENIKSFQKITIRFAFFFLAKVLPGWVSISSLSWS